MAAQIKDQPAIEALPIGASAAAPCGDRHIGPGRLLHHPQQSAEIGRIHRGRHQIGQDTIDRIVRGHRRAQGAVILNLPPKSGGPQVGGKGGKGGKVALVGHGAVLLAKGLEPQNKPS